MKNLNVSKNILNKGKELIQKELLDNTTICNVPMAMVNKQIERDSYRLLDSMLELGEVVSKCDDITNLNDEQMSLITHKLVQYKANEIQFLQELEYRKQEISNYYNNIKEENKNDKS